jgi:hypothetical protein
MEYNQENPEDSTKYSANQLDENAESVSDSAEGLSRRRSLLTSTYSSLQYICSLPRKQFRSSDKVSDLLVLVCLLFAVILILLPSSLLQPTIVILADGVFLAVIVFFIMSRLGILITLSERQAVLVWDIVVGSLLLGILLSFNATYVIAYFHRI